MLIAPELTFPKSVQESAGEKSLTVGKIVSRRENGTMPIGQAKLVCQVAFVEWTDADHLRHCTFIAVRDEKNSSEVVRELAKEES